MKEYRTCHAFRFNTIIQSLLILLLLPCIQLRAENINNIKVSISFTEGEKLDNALKRLEKASGIAMAYDPKVASTKNVKQKVFDNTDLDEVVKFLLTGTGLSFKKEGDNILIYNTPSPNATAGQGNGGIKGRIVEFETSQPLPGASVFIVELKKGVQSDESGYYKFTGVPAGKYTLQVSYISFTTEKVAVTINAGKEATYDVKLQGSNQLTEVVVKGVGKSRAPVAHATEKQVLQEIKASQSIVSGISSQQISKSADRNAAEVVAKIAGVSVRDDKFVVVRGMNERYNLTYLNDNIAPSTELYSRAFALNLLPTRIIDKILVYKSPAPDLLGDMAGGAVKIYTKDAITVKHFDVDFNIGVRPTTAFNNNFLTYKGSKTDFLGFDNGTRALPNTVPQYGDFTKAKISQQQYVSSFSDILQHRRKTALPNLQLTANYYDAFKVFGKTLSSLTSFSYKNESRQNEVERSQRAYALNDGGGYNLTNETQSTETAQMTLLQNFSYRINNRINLRFKNFLLQQGESATVVKQTRNLLYPTIDKNGTIQWNKVISSNDEDKNIVLGYTQRFLYSGNLTGNIVLDNQKHHELILNTGYTHSLQKIPDQRQIRLKRGRIGYIQFPVDDLLWLAAVRDGSPEKNDVERGIISRTWTKNAENAQDATLDYTGKLWPWLTLKAGTYHQWKKRTLFRRVYTVNEGDLNKLGYPDFEGASIGANGRYMDFDRVLFKKQALGQVWSSNYLNDEGFALKVFDRTSGSDAYTATEQSNSGYAAINLQPFGGKVEIYGGIRAEYNRQRVAGAIPEGSITNPTQGGLNYPILVDNKKLSWLPSVNLNIRAWPELVIRGAYGKTLNRPEFRELSPYSELDYLNNQLIYGNSKLTSSEITGYDARAEWYFGSSKSSMISVGGFYKEIDRPIERMLTNNLSFSMPGSITFANADNATIKGLELEAALYLDFIALPIIRNLSLSGNYSRIASEVYRAGNAVLNGTSNPDQFEIRRQLQGQAPYTFNAGIYYEKPAWGTKISLLYNAVGQRIYAAAIGISQEEASNGYQYAQGGYSGSLIELTRRQLDFAFSQRVGKGVQVKLSIQNLLNTPIRVAEDQNFTYKYEPYTFKGNAGETKISGDNMAREYKSDRFFNLAISYSF